MESQITNSDQYNTIRKQWLLSFFISIVGGFCIYMFSWVYTGKLVSQVLGYEVNPFTETILALALNTLIYLWAYKGHGTKWLLLSIIGGIFLILYCNVIIIISLIGLYTYTPQAYLSLITLFATSILDTYYMLSCIRLYKLNKTISQKPDFSLSNVFLQILLGSIYLAAICIHISMYFNGKKIPNIKQTITNIRQISQYDSHLVKNFLAQTAKEALHLSESLDEIKQKFLQDEDHIKSLYDDNYGTYLALIDENNKNCLIGTGALKRIDANTAELKRIFIDSAYRKNGYGRRIVQTLLLFALEHNYKKVRLEVWKPEIQTEAVSFFTKLGFKAIPPYNKTNAGLYLEITFSYDYTDPYFRTMVVDYLSNYIITTKQNSTVPMKKNEFGPSFEFKSPIKPEEISLSVIGIFNKSIFCPTTYPEYSYVVLGGTGHLECKLGNRDLTFGTIIHSYEKEVLFFSECKNLVLGIIKFNNLNK